MALPVWGLAHLDPHKHPLSFSKTLLLAPAMGVCVALLGYLIHSVPPILGEAIACNKSMSRGGYAFRYADFKTFSWHTTPEFLLLTFRRKPGSRVMRCVGVPYGFPISEFSAFLKARGLEEVPWTGSHPFLEFIESRFTPVTPGCTEPTNPSHPGSTSRDNRDP